MAVRPATTAQVAKLTTQLTRGDLITIDGGGPGLGNRTSVLASASWLRARLIPLVLHNPQSSAHTLATRPPLIIGPSASPTGW